jgi:hypothetical protein
VAGDVTARETPSLAALLEFLGKALVVLAAAIPLVGVGVRALAFWMTGRISDPIGVAVSESPTSLAAVGATTLVSLYFGAGVGVFSVGMLLRVAQNLNALDRDAQALQRGVDDSARRIEREVDRIKTEMRQRGLSLDERIPADMLSDVAEWPPSGARGTDLDPLVESMKSQSADVTRTVTRVVEMRSQQRRWYGPWRVALLLALVAGLDILASSNIAGTVVLLIAAVLALLAASSTDLRLSRMWPVLAILLSGGVISGALTYTAPSGWFDYQAPDGSTSAFHGAEIADSGTTITLLGCHDGPLIEIPTSGLKLVRYDPYGSGQTAEVVDVLRGAQPITALATRALVSPCLP